MIKLNLGCGNKIYKGDGWVNVDLFKPEQDVVELTDVKNKADDDRAYFIESDLKELSKIPDEFADEIHAYHVIEHFFVDEVPAVLTEWRRILKHDGKLCLEQPDILKCAANFLAGFHNGNSQLGFNLGLLGFYGAGSEEEPYMGHKWGWTGQTLKTVLHSLNFTEIEEVPALTHAGDVRDFRIEARRP